MAKDHHARALSRTARDGVDVMHTAHAQDRDESMGTVDNPLPPLAPYGLVGAVRRNTKLARTVTES